MTHRHKVGCAWVSPAIFLMCTLAVAGAYGQGGPPWGEPGPPPPGWGGGPPPGVGQPVSRLEFQGVPTTVSLVNAVFSSSSTSIPFEIVKEGGRADIFVTVSSGQSGQFEPRQMVMVSGVGAPVLDYNVFTSAGTIAKDTSVTLGVNNVQRYFLNPGSRDVDGYFEVRIPAGRFVRRGSYADTVVISLYQGTIDNAASAILWDQKAVAVSAVTAEFTAVQVAGSESGVAGNSYTLDFGPILPNAQRGAEIRYRTNMSFSLSMRSQNGGQLVNPTGGFVPYRMEADGVVVSMTDEVLLATSTLGGTGLDFERLPLRVTILPFGILPPGTYTDAITITISTF